MLHPHGMPVLTVECADPCIECQDAAKARKREGGTRYERGDSTLARPRCCQCLQAAGADGRRIGKPGEIRRRKVTGLGRKPSG